MFENNQRYWIIRLISGLLLLVILIGGGYMLFRAGFSQGAVSAAEGELTVPEFSRSLRYHPYPGRFFFPGGFFIGLLFLFLIFGLFRRAVFGPRWGWGAYRMYGAHGMKWKEKAEEWHTEMHARMEEQPGKTDEDPSQETES
ncbi:MAG: hypothetical protein PVI99_00580 [Anaerolineales bacterium]|jgi:hypothetical protein